MQKRNAQPEWLRKGNPVRRLAKTWFQTSRFEIADCLAFAKFVPLHASKRLPIAARLQSSRFPVRTNDCRFPYMCKAVTFRASKRLFPVGKCRAGQSIAPKTASLGQVNRTFYDAAFVTSFALSGTPLAKAVVRPQAFSFDLLAVCPCVLGILPREQTIGPEIP